MPQKAVVRPKAKPTSKNRGGVPNAWSSQMPAKMPPTIQAATYHPRVSSCQTREFFTLLSFATWGSIACPTSAINDPYSVRCAARFRDSRKGEVPFVLSSSKDQKRGVVRQAHHERNRRALTPPQNSDGHPIRFRSPDFGDLTLRLQAKARQHHQKALRGIVSPGES